MVIGLITSPSSLTVPPTTKLPSGPRLISLFNLIVSFALPVASPVSSSISGSATTPMFPSVRSSALLAVALPTTSTFLFSLTATGLSFVLPKSPLYFMPSSRVATGLSSTIRRVIVSPSLPSTPGAPSVVMVTVLISPSSPFIPIEPGVPGSPGAPSLPLTTRVSNSGSLSIITVMVVVPSSACLTVVVRLSALYSWSSFASTPTILTVEFSLLATGLSPSSSSGALAPNFKPSSRVATGLSSTIRRVIVSPSLPSTPGLPSLVMVTVLISPSSPFIPIEPGVPGSPGAPSLPLTTTVSTSMSRAREIFIASVPSFALSTDVIIFPSLSTTGSEVVSSVL